MLKNAYNTILFVVVMLILTCCQNQTVSNELKTDSLNSGDSKNDKMYAKDSSLYFDSSKLVGIWKKDSSENSIFTISNDTITYTDQINNPFTFKVIGDRFIINFGDYQQTNAILTLNDSIFELKDLDDNSSTRYFKIR